MTKIMNIVKFSSLYNHGKLVHSAAKTEPLLEAICYTYTDTYSRGVGAQGHWGHMHPMTFLDCSF